MKIRHTLLALLAILVIAFMQPLVFFVGGLTVLLGIGAWIFRDLPPSRQDKVEGYILGWLRRVRSNSAPPSDFSAVRSGSTAMNAPPSNRSTERTRRVRGRTSAAIGNDSVSNVATASPITDEATTAAITSNRQPPPTG